MMKENLIRSVLFTGIFCLQTVTVSPVYALPPLSHVPLFLGGNVSPNVMFTLDDSGSMHFEIMPGHLIIQAVRYTFPRANNVYGPSDYSNYVVGFDTPNRYTASLRSSTVNRIYYNPSVSYLPWSNADGSLMPNADPTCALHNPVRPVAGCRNLTANNTQTARWLNSNGTRSSWQSRTFYPAVYFRYDGGDINAAGSYTQVEIKPSTSTYTGGANRLDCAAVFTCTYDEEMQNFANWYTYYRSRILLARAGVGKAFAEQGNTMRVGFATLNKGSEAIDGVSTNVIVKGVRQFAGADRTGFFESLYERDAPAAGTPLRNALDRVGRYYQRTDDKGPWSETPGSDGGVQHECRQNYNILMTDGYWGGSAPSNIGNADDTAGASMTNDTPSATPTSYTYVPELPFADSHSNTLADVAMHYWKNDLRPDMLNKVPYNDTNPAFWQHMVTFTVGLGVNGSLTELPTGSETWPDPTASNAYKIDDLWHAAVNSRGAFFSAADPVIFTNALSNSLSSILEQIGTGSAVATNSRSLRNHGRVYLAKFNSGDWSGQLFSVPFDAQGNFDVPEWDASTASLAPAVINPSTRVILTKGSTDGVSFEYANLTAEQKALLDQDALGTNDNCGPERVAYIRGSNIHESAGGTFNCASATDVNKFRLRPNTKLGDIVNSNPFLVDRPGAGYSDVDHPGYGAFHSTYKDRLPVIYVGANDGMLHGFNACIPGITTGCSATDAGKELITYIPSMVYDNLSRLTDKNYNDSHRYFADGSPMVADVNIGQWRTVLVSSLGGGGKGYYALDVTDPTSFTTANAASLLLWEFSELDDTDLGYTYNLPPVNFFSGQAKQIVKMENDRWAVVVGNGYNSDDGRAVLYILFLNGGEDGSWTPGTDYIKLVADAGPGNGLSTPVPFDSNGNGKADTIYAGDLKGNLWRFDVSANSPSSWNVGIGGLPLFAAGVSKPIVSPPMITLHPYGGQLILFGTGKYLETGDTTDTNTQSVYGIWDHNTSSTVVVGDLVQQEMFNTSPRTATQYPVDYSNTVKGWFMDLPVAGERITGLPKLINTIFTFDTIVPSVSPCDFGGDGYLMSLNFLTGGMFSHAAFDLNGNRVFGDDSVSAGVKTIFSPGGSTALVGQNSILYVTPCQHNCGQASSGQGGGQGGGQTLSTPGWLGPANLKGRITWRELVQ